jgi:hypothetical protein
MEFTITGKQRWSSYYSAYRHSISLLSGRLVIAECLSASASHDSLRYLDLKHESAPRLGVRYQHDAHISSKLAETVTLLIYIRDVHGSYLGRAPIIISQVLCGSPQPLQTKADKVLKPRLLSFTLWNYVVISALLDIQSDSKILSGFPYPIIFKPYVTRKARMLQLFSILPYWFC